MTQHKPVLATANICWHGENPYNLDFNDYYYNSSDGIAESEYVFINGNKLPGRWHDFESKKQKQFLIFETGFGSGLNFLTTAECWLNYQNQKSPKYLHSLCYSSVEAYPLTKGDFKKIIASWASTFKLGQNLVDCYPCAIEGVYSFSFQSIQLKLYLMPLDKALACLEPKGQPLFDCLFLDGFAPSKNQSMWQSKLLRRLSYSSKHKSTFSTFSAASAIQRDLKNCGYAIKKIKGYGFKREMLTGTLLRQEKFEYKSKSPWFEFRQQKPITETVIIVGAGVAGCGTAYALAQHEIKSLLIEAQPGPAGTLANFKSSAFSPYLSADFNRISQFYWQAYTLLEQYLRQSLDIDYQLCGSFLTANRADRLKTYQSVYKLLKASGIELDWVKSNQTHDYTKMDLNAPGLFNHHSGWLNASSYCLSLINHPLIKTEFNSKITKLEKQSTDWQLYTDDKVIHSTHVVLCCGSSNLINKFQLCRLDHIKGQVTKLSLPVNLSKLDKVINTGHYLLPTSTMGEYLTGSNYLRNDINTNQPDTNADIENLQAFTKLNAQLDETLVKVMRRLSNITQSNSPCGVRLATRDHLPVIGPVPDMNFYRQHYSEFLQSGRLKNCPNGKYLDGLFINSAHGSRGITASLLAGEIIAALISGRQLPLPSKLYHAVHPARFFVRDAMSESTFCS